MNKLASEAYSLLCKQADELPVNPYAHYISKYMGIGAATGATLGTGAAAIAQHSMGNKSPTATALRVGAGLLGGGWFGGALGGVAGTMKAMGQNGRVMYDTTNNKTYMK